MTKFLQRQRSVEAGAPSTILLRKMVPLPRASRGCRWRQALPFSRCGGIRAFGTARHESVASRQI